MEVIWLNAALVELAALPAPERVAMGNAAAKLEAHGALLAFPHSSQVKGANNLRELRPRRGNSAWRAFYRRVGNVIVIAAVGPEARVNNRSFSSAVRAAEERLDQIEDQATW